MCSSMSPSQTLCGGGGEKALLKADNRLKATLNNKCQKYVDMI